MNSSFSSSSFTPNTHSSKLFKSCFFHSHHLTFLPSLHIPSRFWRFYANQAFGQTRWLFIRWGKILSRFSNPLRAKITKNIDWSTGPLAGPFSRTAHSFACFALLASLASLRSTAITRSLARSLRSLPRTWDSEWLEGYLICVFFLFWPTVQPRFRIRVGIGLHAGVADFQGRFPCFFFFDAFSHL